MPKTIAMIGLGAMGFAMAKRLAERQHRVIGFDVRPEPMKALEAARGHSAPTAADAVRDADVVILLVLNADQVDQVLFEDGVLDATRPDTPIIDMATSAPSRVSSTAERVVAAGRQFIDAPVSGGVSGVEAGTLTIMAAAPVEAFSGVEDLLREIGSNTFHLGENYGRGAAMKTVNQLLTGVHIAAAGEALALAEAEGIDLKMALQILTGSAASSWMMRDRGPRMIAPGDEVRSAIDIFVKDLKIVADAGHARRFGLPLAATALQLYLGASRSGLGKADDSQIIAYYRMINGSGTKGA